MKKSIVTNEFAEPARNLAEDLRELLAVTTHVAGKKAAATRQYLTATMEKSASVWHTVQARAVFGTKAADRLIHRHPYPSLGIALGLGLILGFVMHARE